MKFQERFFTKILLVMKLTAIILLGFTLQLSAKAVSQTITYTAKEVSLTKVFSIIKKQTGFVVFYDQDWIELAKPISITAKDQTLVSFLDKILVGLPLDFTVKGKTIIITRKSNVSTLDPGTTEGILAPAGSIQGRITNENGEALVGASLTIKDINLGATTDNNGYYKISTIAAGNYEMEISFVGYVTKKVTVKVTEKKAVALNFTLQPSLMNLDEMTVTSTLSKRAIRAYPATIAEIKQEDLKNRNINNIANVLEAIPGIIVTPGSEINNGASNNKRTPEGILIRGSNPGVSIKFLLDGVETIAAGYLSILQTIDPNNIEKIEILKGPMASTLYGSGAAGGIISITTKKGKSGKAKFNFKTMFTQYANDYANNSGYNQNYSVNVSGGTEQFSYLLGAAYNLYPTTKLTDINNGIDDKTWSYNARIGGKVHNFTADLSLQYGTERNGAGANTISENKYRASLGLSLYTIDPLQDNRQFQRSFLTSLHLNHTIAGNWYQDLTVGYSIMNNTTNTYTPDYSGNYFNQEILYSKINARYFMFYDHSWSAYLKTNITAGFEYNGFEMHNLFINSTEPLTNFFTINTPASEMSASYMKSPYSSTGYFAEAVTGFRNNLFLTTGIRYDVNPAYGKGVGAYAQPRVGLSYVIESGVFKMKPRVVWGVSSTPPEPTYKITTTTIYPGYILTNIGNPTIKPQRSEGYEFGADLFYGSIYSLNVTYYDQRIKDMIQQVYTYDFSSTPNIFYINTYNIAQVVNRGIEVSAKAVLDPFTLDLSYTQTRSKWGNETGPATTPIDYPGAQISNIPQKSIFARLSYKIPSILPWTKQGGRISMDWRYNGSVYNFDAISYYLAVDAWNGAPDPKPNYPDFYSYYSWQKGYSYFNLRADYSITNYAVLYIDVQNLLDKQGSVNGNILERFPGRRVNFGFNIML